MGQKTDDAEATPTDQRLILLADYAPTAVDALSMLPTVLPPTPTLTPTTARRIDVEVVRATTQTGRLTVRLHIFNGQPEPLTLNTQSIWLAYGYVERPDGPRIAAQLQPITIAPFQAADVTLTYAWSGEPYAMLGVSDDYQYSLVLR